MEAAIEVLIRSLGPDSPEGKPLTQMNVRQKLAAAEELVERHLSDVASCLLPDDFWMTARDLCDSRDQIARSDWAKSNEAATLAVSFEPRSLDVEPRHERFIIERVNAIAQECDRGRSYLGGLIDAYAARKRR